MSVKIVPNMDHHIEKLAKSVGMKAGRDAIDIYKERDSNFDNAWVKPMMYSSGYTAGRVTLALSKEWIVPLKKRTRITGLAALISLALLVAAVAYNWSIMDFETFSRFLASFFPAIAALIFVIAKSFKTWAEAKRTLAEAKNIEKSIDVP